MTEEVSSRSLASRSASVPRGHAPLSWPLRPNVPNVFLQHRRARLTYAISANSSFLTKDNDITKVANPNQDASPSPPLPPERTRLNWPPYLYGPHHRRFPTPRSHKISGPCPPSSTMMKELHHAACRHKSSKSTFLITVLPTHPLRSRSYEYIWKRSVAEFAEFHSP